ncbi:MAG TPA: fibronectin type III domain-containing protein [Terriglobales bacterium]
MKKLLLALTLVAFFGTLLHAQDADDRMKHPQAEKITHGPVVEQVGRDFAVVAWSTNTGGSSVIRYGTNPSQMTQMAEAPYADNEKTQGQTHRVHINHLQPGTTYFFIVDSGQGEGTGTEAKSSVMQFTTKH